MQMKISYGHESRKTLKNVKRLELQKLIRACCAKQGKTDAECSSLLRGTALIGLDTLDKKLTYYKTLAKFLNIN